MCDNCERSRGEKESRIQELITQEIKWNLSINAEVCGDRLEISLDYQGSVVSRVSVTLPGGSS